MTLRGLRVFFLLATCAYVALRLAAFLPASPLTFPDTGTYLHTANEPLLSQEFWAGWRPWTVPLLYKLLPDDDTVRAVAQLVVSIACWLALAAAVAWNVRHPVMRSVAFCVVLLFSLSVWIAQWDPLILSDSLAVSLTAAVLAAWLAVVRAPGVWTVAAVLLTTLLWAFTRDSLASLALFSLPFVLVWAAVSRRRREPLALAVGLLAIAGASWVTGSSETAAARERAAVLNVIGGRVLTDADELRYFRDQGMPLPSVVAQFAGTPLATSEDAPLQPGEPLASDPRVARFLAWAREDGRKTLVRYLLSHPYRALEPVVDDADLLLEPEPGHAEHNTPLSSFRADGTEPLLPEPVEAAVYPPWLAAVLAWLGLAAVAAAFVARLGLARPVWLVPAIAVLLQAPHAALVWNADPVGITRHSLTVGVLTRLGLLVLTIFLVDAVLEWRARQRRSVAIAGVSGVAR